MNAPPARAGRERSTPAGPPPGTVREGEIHVWHGSLDAAPVPVQVPVSVSAAEAARAARMRSPRRRHEFLVCRGRLRHILGTVLGIDPREVPIVEEEHGKPRLRPESRLPPVGFNLSHSGDRFMVAVACGMNPGVDIERIRPRRSVTALARRFFSPAEQGEVAAAPDRMRAFYRIWSRKEAVIKADGRGVAIGLDRFDVNAGEPPVLREARWPGASPDEAARWSLHALDPGPGYAAALAVRHPDVAVVLRTVPEPEAQRTGGGMRGGGSAPPATCPRPRRSG